MIAKKRWCSSNYGALCKDIAQSYSMPPLDSTNKPAYLKDCVHVFIDNFLYYIRKTQKNLWKLLPCNEDNKKSSSSLIPSRST